ncbi:MAG: methylated-DNA--[protein]-cysteine S-methyltransferase [Anaerolineales bacterium]
MVTESELEQALDQLYAVGPPRAAAVQALASLREQVEAWQPQLWYGSLAESSVGALLVAVSARGVVAVDFGDHEARFVGRLRQVFGVEPIRSAERAGPAVRQLDEYVQGTRTAFDLPVDLGACSDFQRRVLKAAAAVPRGRLATYGEIAARIGAPHAARAVGQALARNPVPIIVPCHRVVAADGSLTGYSGGAGVETKAILLRLEGAAIA